MVLVGRNGPAAIPVFGEGARLPQKGGTFVAADPDMGVASWRVAGWRFGFDLFRVKPEGFIHLGLQQGFEVCNR